VVGDESTRAAILCSVFVQPGDDVGVNVQREGDSGMSEALADHLCGHAGLQRKTRVGVSQVVEMDAWNISRPQVPFEPQGHGVGVNVGAVLASEDEAGVVPRRSRCQPLLILLDPPLSQCCNGLGVKGDVASAARTLRFPVHDPVVDRSQCLAHGGSTEAQVHVLQAQPQQLTSPHTR
jgi:hypothetical protein